jgi:hypothetical protein
MLDVTENREAFPVQVSLPEGGIALPDLVSQLNAEINRRGRVITALKLNGRECDLLKLDADVIVQDGERVDLESDLPGSIARRSLEDVLSQIDSFREELDAIVSDLARGDRESSFRRFTRFLSEFRDIIQLLKTIESLFDLSYAEIRFEGGKSLQEFTEELINILTEIKNAMENEDLVTLTDLLEYEVKETVFDDLEKVLPVLSDRLND